MFRYDLEYEDFNIDSLDKLSYQIKKIESIIRNSKIYKRYLGKIYSEFPCVISPDYSDINLLNSEMETEFHHIITLYDLVQIVGSKMIADNEYDFLTYLDVAKEVLKVHMEDLIPGCVLSVSYHQAIHAEERQLDPELTGLHIGNWKEFIRRYSDFLSENDFKKYNLIGISTKQIEEVLNVRKEN